MARISNRQVRAKVEGMKQFRTNNGTIYGDTFTGRDGSEWYAVFSYGPHFPMYVCDKTTGKWFGNRDRASSTTSRHQSHARPHGEDIEFLPSDEMEALAYLGPNRYVQEKVAEAAGI